MPDERLALLSREPLNAETRLEAHLGLITPTAAFYKRNHFPFPVLSTAGWRLAVEGLVERPASLTYDQLRALPSRTLLVTLECAGNARTDLKPPAEGEPWGYGAVSTAEWTGVPLSHVLQATGISSSAVEVIAYGADAGHVPAAGATLSYARSLPITYTLESDALLAYAMNGEPLPPEHGFPVRLIVPGWYGMASVKWVTRLVAVADPFRGFYQADRYVMAHPGPDEIPPTPLTTVAVRSLIAHPPDGASLPSGTHVIRGLAWSGAAPVAQVAVSLDGGQSWQPAELTGDPARYAWRRWEYTLHINAPGQVSISSRAVDSAGNTQPAEPVWNYLGYANNAVQTIRLTVV
jgi:DMSO/TMAO reductase YedYZ molybdopterin-dependent catalytic subunit